MEEPDKSFEFSKQYAHAIISGQTKDPKIVAKKIKETVQNYKENGIPDEEFERIKKKNIRRICNGIQSNFKYCKNVSS